MPTLHNVTENTKQILKIGGIIVLTITTIFLLFRAGVFLKDFFFPTPPPPPTVSFGILTKPDFPQSVSENLTYTIDTVTGALPTFSDSEGTPLDRVSVYQIFNPTFSLLDLQNTKRTVSRIGFVGKEVSLGNNIYQWTTIQENLQRVIEMNIVNKHFNYASPFRNFERVLNAIRMPDRTSSVNRAEGFLKSMDLFPTDIDRTKTRTELLFIEDEELLPAQTLREAQIIRVNFYQNNINETPLFYDTPPYSSLSVYIASGERFDPDVVQADFVHQLITEESSTYPIKPVTQAFEELKEGQGYVAANYRNETNIKIKEVLMGYYLSSKYQEYLIPVYVFKGLNDDFYAYVYAVTNDWFEKDEADKPNISEETN